MTHHRAAAANFTRAERIADVVVHSVGLVLTAIGLPFLFIAGFSAGSAALAVSLPLYGVGLVAMLVASLLYNAWAPSRTKEVLLRFDHAAIFLMIAGTYSPFALAMMGGAWGISLFSVLWSLAGIGVIGSLILGRGMARFMVVLCLAMGWSVIVAIYPLLQSVSTTVIVLLAAGGVAYSAGVIFHVRERWPFNNVAWHGFVVAAAACHFFAVLVAVSDYAA